jgi:hypothetical protein
VVLVLGDLFKKGVSPFSLYIFLKGVKMNLGFLKSKKEFYFRVGTPEYNKKIKKRKRRRFIKKILFILIFLILPILLFLLCSTLYRF